jgi:hypothetical protein
VRGILFLGIFPVLVVAGAISSFFGKETDESDRPAQVTRRDAAAVPPWPAATAPAAAPPRTIDEIFPSAQQPTGDASQRAVPAKDIATNDTATTAGLNIISLSDYARRVKHQWVKYAEERQGSMLQTSYVDLASIIRMGNMVTVLDLQNWDPFLRVSTTGELLGSTLSLMRYDCGSTPRSMIMAGVTFHGHMGGGTQQDGAADVPKEPRDGWYVMPSRWWDGKPNLTLKARDMACNGMSSLVTTQTQVAPSPTSDVREPVTALSFDEMTGPIPPHAGPASQNRKWVKVSGPDLADYVAFVDMNSVFRKGNLAVITYLDEYREQQLSSGNYFSSTTGQIAFDCSSTKFKAGPFYEYQEHGGKGVVVHGYDRWAFDVFDIADGANKDTINERDIACSFKR